MPQYLGERERESHKTNVYVFHIFAECIYLICGNLLFEFTADSVCVFCRPYICYIYTLGLLNARDVGLMYQLNSSWGFFLSFCFKFRKEVELKIKRGKKALDKTLNK